MTWLVAPHMLAAGGGRIVNLNSGAARRAGADASAYNVSKTALARVTGSTHLAGWARGIRAFDLMPGVVRTDMTESMDAHAGRTEWTDPAEVTELVLALVSGGSTRGRGASCAPASTRWPRSRHAPGRARARRAHPRPGPRGVRPPHLTASHNFPARSRNLHLRTRTVVVRT